jgi:DNA mismatch repair protein MutS
MGIIIEYLTLQKKYEAIYGPKTVIFIMLGTFYDVFGYYPSYCLTEGAKVDKNKKVWNEDIGYALEMSELLNAVFTTRRGDAEPYGIRNCNMVGVLVVAFEKYIPRLLTEDYTIVLYDEEKSNKSPKTRFISNVISPSMNIGTISLQPTVSNNTVMVYMECINNKSNKFSNYLVAIGVALIDASTGSNRVCELYSEPNDPGISLQNLYRFIISNHPKELIIHLVDFGEKDVLKHPSNNDYSKYIERILQLHRFDRTRIFIDELPKEYHKIAYQTEFFNRVFTKTKGEELQRVNHRVIESLNLERMNYGRIAFLALLQHCDSYNPTIIKRLSKPDTNYLDTNRHLILAHNAIEQLDLVTNQKVHIRNNKKIDCLFAVLDHNRTLLGKRAMLNLLQNPLVNPEEIESYYEMVEDMLHNNLYLTLDQALREIPDLARLHCQLDRQIISPRDLSVLYQAYLKIINIYTLITNANTNYLHSQLLSERDIQGFNQYITRYGTIFEISKLAQCTIESFAEKEGHYMNFQECPIRKGIFPALDQQVLILEQAEQQLQLIVNHLNEQLDAPNRMNKHLKGKRLEIKQVNTAFGVQHSKGNVKAESRKKKGKGKGGPRKQDQINTLLLTSASKVNVILGSYYDEVLCGKLKSQAHSASETAVTSDKISSLLSTIDQVRMDVRLQLVELYYAIIDEMLHFEFYLPLNNLIAKLDVVHSYAKVSYEYGYYRPEIVSKDDSYLEATDIRHPVIERVISGKYVTNDISLGNGALSKGMLLFGINQTGKSSLAKAVAINIIMAQAGCFTPSRLKYVPYHNIITRLNNGTDDMINGQSTFAIEMTELNTILRQGGNKTLVLGDELSSGTEIDSGLCIVASALKWMLRRNVTFIFATHFHELLELEVVKNIAKTDMAVKHLSMTRDPETNTLIYDRKLTDGSGESNYGIMVAQSLDLPDEFIATAYEILKEVQKKNSMIVMTNRNKYNPEVYIDKCIMCGKDKKAVLTNTHHIIHQAEADKRRMVENTSIDSPAYLSGLCVVCHQNLHRKNEDLAVKDIGNGRIVLKIREQNVCVQNTNKSESRR